MVLLWPLCRSPEQRPHQGVVAYPKKEYGILSQANNEPCGRRDSPPVLYYTSIGSPLGELWLAATQEGICGLGFGSIDESWLKALARDTGTVPHLDPTRFAEVCRQIAQYFAGARHSFDLALDLLRGSAFQRRVWAATRLIPYGQVHTYGQVARAIDAPRSARAVGRALGSNPVPIIVPCHRVLRADGSLGGYGAGLDIKRALLRLEGYI